MKALLHSITIFLFISFLFGCNKRTGKPRVLVFTKTTGFRHSSIPPGIQAVIKLGASNGFDVDTTENAGKFIDDSLKNYSVIIFLNTTGDVLNFQQQVAFERFIQSGGGYVGIHSATDTEYDWQWYGGLAGGYFNGHPQIQQATLNIKDNQHTSTKHLPPTWTRTDEWYNFKSLNKDTHVLITIDEKTYNGGTNGADHPMAWYHDYDGGRAFYTELGHTEESYSDPLYLQHILGGIKYAIGHNSALNYGDAKSEYSPEIAFINVNKLSGELPFKVKATVEAKYSGKEPLIYLWNFGNGVKEETKIPEAEHIYSVPGEYTISVEVSDKKHDTAKSNTITIYAGNEEPIVDINISSNKTFYFPGKPVEYSVSVKVPDTIDVSNLVVIADYVEGNNKEVTPLAHLSASEKAKGKNIMLVNDCSTCHKENEKSVGPAFIQVAMMYKNDTKVISYLVDKIKKGRKRSLGRNCYGCASRFVRLLICSK